MPSDGRASLRSYVTYIAFSDRDSSVGMVASYGLDGRDLITVKGKRFFYTPASRPALGPTQPPIHWGKPAEA
jgi:hypothetical protein